MVDVLSSIARQNDEALRALADLSTDPAYRFRQQGVSRFCLMGDRSAGLMPQVKEKAAKMSPAEMKEVLDTIKYYENKTPTPDLRPKVPDSPRYELH